VEPDKGYIQTDPLAGKIERPQPILRGRDARMSEELMDMLISECFEKATYNRKNRTDKPSVHLRNVGFTEQFGRRLWLLRSTGARPIELRKPPTMHPRDETLRRRRSNGIIMALAKSL
jgi:hypothetical protein